MTSKDQEIIQGNAIDAKLFGIQKMSQKIQGKLSNIQRQKITPRNVQILPDFRRMSRARANLAVVCSGRQT